MLVMSERWIDTFVMDIFLPFMSVCVRLSLVDGCRTMIIGTAVPTTARLTTNVVTRTCYMGLRYMKAAVDGRAKLGPQKMVSPVDPSASIRSGTCIP